MKLIFIDIPFCRTVSINMMCNVKAKIVTFTVLPLYPSDSSMEQGNYSFKFQCCDSLILDYVLTALLRDIFSVWILSCQTQPSIITKNSIKTEKKKVTQSSIWFSLRMNVFTQLYATPFLPSGTLSTSWWTNLPNLWRKSSHWTEDSRFVHSRLLLWWLSWTRRRCPASRRCSRSPPWSWPPAPPAPGCGAVRRPPCWPESPPATSP